MLTFFLRRVLFIFLVAASIVYFTFLGMTIISRGTGTQQDNSFSTAAVQAWENSREFFSGLFQGDPGSVPTVSGEEPVADLATQAFKNSLGLLSIALLCAVILGVLAGGLAAVSRSRRREFGLLFATLAGVSIPSFAMAVLLQMAGISYTVTFGSRLVSMGGFEWDIQHMLLPVLVLAARPLAYITRATYLAMKAVMDEDYIRTAYAKGLSQSRTALVHALRNMGISLLSAIGVSLRFSLSVLPIVEFIFGWPGLGLRFLEGINNRVPLQVVTLALIIGLTIQVISFLLDLSYRFIDPRLRSVA